MACTSNFRRLRVTRYLVSAMGKYYCLVLLVGTMLFWCFKDRWLDLRHFFDDVLLVSIEKEICVHIDRLMRKLYPSISRGVMR